MAPCPSVKELLNIKALTRQRDGVFQTAWDNSFPDSKHCSEAGGYIYTDFPVVNPIRKIYITWVQKRDRTTMNQRTKGPNASINLNKPGTKAKNVVLVANFHTHPLSQLVGGDPAPSRADQRNAEYRGLPGIVVSRRGIYAYGPERREKLNNPKGYPGSASSLVTFETTQCFAGDKPARNPPPPWVVKNQWPEGTGRVATEEAPADDYSEPSAEDELSSIDVEYVDWSDEDVEYGEVLEESGDATVDGTAEEESQV